MGDLVLERNICFVDTSHDRTPDFAATYIKQQLSKSINTAQHGSSELVGLLSGSGGCQVDLVMYLVSHGKFCHARSI